MRQKFLLLLAIILTVAQGWASPVDSLKTHLTGDGAQQQIQGLTKTDGLKPFVVEDPVISVNPSSLNFGQVVMGKTVTKTFVVKGVGLKGSLKLDLLLTRSAQSSEKFTVSPTTITASRALRGATVTITYAPNELGADGGTIVIKGGGAENKSVTLSGAGVAAPSPSITVTPTTLIIPDDSNSGRLIVRGTNLTGPLTLKSNSSLFTVSPSTITEAELVAGKTVTVTCKPTALGSYTGTITISGGGAENKTVRVIKKYAAPTITVTPATLDFGTVVIYSGIVGQTVHKTFKVKGTNLTSPLTVISSNTCFMVSPTTITPEQAADGKDVTVIYRPTVPGEYTTTITITDGTVSTTVLAKVRCVSPTLTITPSSGSFGTVNLGEHKAITFTVKGADLTEPLSVSLNDPTKSFTTSVTTITPTQVTNGKSFNVVYSPHSVGTHTATLEISGRSFSATITLIGNCVVPVPEITVPTTSLDFGTIVKGSSSSKTLKVTAIGLTSPLTVTLNDPSRSFSASPSTISPSDAETGIRILVTYKPTSVGAHSATLKIASGGLSKTVILKGRCVEGAVMMGEIEPEDENGEYCDLKSYEVTKGTGNAALANVSLLAETSKIYVEGRCIIIESPVEQSAIISDIAGHTRRVSLQAGRNEISVNSSGLQIVRVAQQSAKLMIR